VSSHGDKRRLVSPDFPRNIPEVEALLAENQQLRDALEQAHADLESILPPRGHEELAQGVYFAHKRIDKALAAVRVEEA
jgi:virulence-associated protein VapD